MKQFFANKYVQGITQYIKDEHFGTMDYIDWYCEQMGLSREEYMAGYRIAIDLRLAENKKPGPDPYHTGLDDEDVEDKEDQIKKQAEMDVDDPDAYKEMPGDKEAREKGEVKTSKHVKSYHELYGDEDEKNEAVDASSIDNAKFRLKNVYKHLDVEYGETRRGDKYVQIHYIPVTRPQSQNPEWVKVFYDNDVDLKKISKELGMDLKESVLNEEKAVVESVVTEGKMPDKYIGNDEIVFLKTKEDSRGANYNLYYKGHDIDAGGRRFGSEKELKDFAANYILSNQWYNKLKYEDSKPLPESVVNENIRIGKVLAIKKYNAKTNREEVVDVRVTDYIKKPGSKDFVEYDFKGKKRKVSINVFKSMIVEDIVNVTPESIVNEATIPKGMKKQDFKDVIDGDQVELIDKGGKRFGSTTEVDNHEVFWINGKQNRELLKKIGEKEFIKQLKKIYDIDVKEVM